MTKSLKRTLILMLTSASMLTASGCADDPASRGLLAIAGGALIGGAVSSLVTGKNTLQGILPGLLIGGGIGAIVGPTITGAMKK